MKQCDLPKWESQDQTLSPLPSLLRNFTVCPMAVMALGIIQWEQPKPPSCLAGARHAPWQMWGLHRQQGAPWIHPERVASPN